MLINSGVSDAWIGLVYSNGSYSWPEIGLNASYFYLNNLGDYNGTYAEERNTMILSDSSWTTVSSDSTAEAVVCFTLSFSDNASNEDPSEDYGFYTTEFMYEFVAFIAENYLDFFDYVILVNGSQKIGFTIDGDDRCEANGLMTSIIFTEELNDKVSY